MNQENLPSSTAESEQEELSQESRVEPVARWPRWIKVVLLGCPLIILVSWLWFGDRDHAIAHAISFVSIVVTATSLLTWFVWISDYQRRWRLWAAGLTVLAGFATVILFRLEGVNGELIPRLRLRWAASRALDQPTHQDADLSTTTSADFPQFLGPDRSGAIENRTLAEDWNKQPPKRLWTHGVGEGWSGFAAVNGYAVTMEQRGQHEWVTCYEIKTGELCWKHGIKTRHQTFLGGVGPRSTPTIDGGKVYALGATGILRCLQGNSGSLVWRQDLLQLAETDVVSDLQAVAWGRSASPLVVDGKVVIPLGGLDDGKKISLIALDKETGKPLWRSGDRQVSYSSPTLMTLAGKRQVVTVNEDNVSGHDVQTGQVLWQHDWDGQSNGAASVSQPVAIAADQVLLSKGYQQGAMALRVEPTAGNASSHPYTASPTWIARTVLKTKFTNVTQLDGFAYGLSDGILECVDLGDGTRRWKRGRYGHGQLLRVGRQCLVLSEKGTLYLIALSPQGLQVQGEIEVVQEKCWATLCLYGSQLLIRSVDQIACYEIPLLDSSEDRSPE